MPKEQAPQFVTALPPALGYKPGDYPQSEQAQEEVLSLPMYPELTEEQIEKIARLIEQWMEQL